MKTIRHVMHGSDLPTFKRNVSNDICLLQNRLFSPSFGYLNQPLPQWIAKLRMTLREIQLARKFEDDARIAEVFSQSAIVFMELEQSGYAREVCYSQIQLFIRSSKKYNLPHLLKFVFEPWLLLIQINRLDRAKYDAFNQLNALDWISADSYVMDENKLLREKIFQALQQDNVLHHTVIIQGFLERSRLLLENRQYDELIAFVENKINQVTVQHDVVVREALAIAYANQGKAQKALTILTQGRSFENQRKNLVLMLRELELRLVLGVDQKAGEALVSLYKLSLSLLDNNFHFHVNYMLHLATLMQMAGLTEKSIKLVYDCFDVAVEVGDERLAGESLIMLYRWVKETTPRKNIEKLMARHYGCTHYPGVRRKMAHCFNELKTANIKGYPAEMRSLFEDLLTFDMICC